MLKEAKDQKSKHLNIFEYLQVSGDTMLKQINLKMPEPLFKAAKAHVEHFGYKNIQELALESMREKIFEKEQYDDSFTEKEIELIDKIITKSLKKKAFATEEELRKALRK